MDKNTSFIGIDIGTSSICGVAYNASSKEIISITKANYADVKSPNTWEKIQDVEIIIHIVKDLIQIFESMNLNIKGIGLSGQMHGILYVDEAGNSISPLYTWRDMRGELTYKNGLSYVDYLSQESGLLLFPGYGLVTHFYNQKNGLVPKNTAKLCTIMDYVAMRLTGNTKPLMDSSNADSLGFFNKKQLVFYEFELNKVEIDCSILPILVKKPSIVGYYGRIPVYTAIGDNQASFLGSVRAIDKSIHIMVGTSSQLSVYSSTFVEVPPLDTRPLPGGGYILVGAGLSGGASFTLLKNFFHNTIKLFVGQEITDSELYKTMLSVPNIRDNKNEICVETLFDGSRQHPKERGKISNISSSNWTPESLIIGFLKGISHELFKFYQALPSAVRENKNILIGSGNGLRKNPLLCHIIEEHFGYKLSISSSNEEASLGACIHSMVAAGYISNFSDFEL